MQPLKLGSSKQQIVQALERLLSKPNDDRPFVIIEDVATLSVFVQFAGSDRESLTFDAPMLERQQIIVRYPDRCTQTDLERAANMAIAALYELGLVPESAVLINEEVTNRAAPAAD